MMRSQTQLRLVCLLGLQALLCQMPGVLGSRMHRTPLRKMLQDTTPVPVVPVIPSADTSSNQSVPLEVSNSTLVVIPPPANTTEIVDNTTAGNTTEPVPLETPPSPEAEEIVAVPTPEMSPSELVAEGSPVLPSPPPGVVINYKDLPSTPVATPVAEVIPPGTNLTEFLALEPNCTDVPPDADTNCTVVYERGLCEAIDVLINGYCMRTCGFPPCPPVPEMVLEADPPISETCTDTPPDDRFTCQEQRAWGKCQSDFMVKGNFCAETCGRAPCPVLNNTQQADAPVARRLELCTDMPPADNITCAALFAEGACGDEWMVDGGWCAATCGRPPCPPLVGASPSPAIIEVSAPTTPSVPLLVDEDMAGTYGSVPAPEPESAGAYGGVSPGGGYGN